MEPGGRAVYSRLRQVRADCLDHGIAAAHVPLAQQAMMPFQVARRHEPGKHELRQDGITEVGVPLGGHDGLAQQRRDQEPADPERRREELGDAARVTDPVGQHRVQGRDGRPVVAMLRVVVVLDDQPPSGRPLPQVAAPRAVEDNAHRELVRRGDHDGRSATRSQIADAQAAVVDTHRRRREAPALQLLPRAE